jgi:hypothetical protein
MQAAGDEFFALIGEGAGLLKELDENDAGFFDSLNRLREILAMLGDPAPALVKLDFNLADKDASLVALAGYLDGPLQSLPAALRPYEASTVHDLTVIVASNSDGPLISQNANSLIDKTTAMIRDIAQSPERRHQQQLDAFEEIKSRGVVHGLDVEMLKNNVEESGKLLAQSRDDNPEYKAANDEYIRLVSEHREMTRRYNQLMVDADKAGDTAEGDRLGAEYVAAQKASREARERAWTAAAKASADFNDTKAAKHAALFLADGIEIINAVMAASPISEEQATAWASEQVIDDNAKAKLKRLGYAPADVLRDMAEFYRLSGGKSSAIRIGIDGGRRANASGISARLNEKIINLGSRFNKTVLFHELAHHLENDPIAKAASNGFLLKRRESDKTYRLKELTGNGGYDRREIAYKDSFTDPYVGKVYTDGVTEVFSMGVQYLSTPKDAAIFAGKDPEMFALITGYLTSPLTPAMDAKLHMHRGAIGALQEKRQGEADMYDKAVELMAGKVEIAKDNWYSTLDKDSRFYDLLLAYVLSKEKKSNPEYIGSAGEFKVFSGVFRNRQSKRYGKGFLIVKNEPSEQGVTGGWSIPEYETVNGDLDQAKLMIALAGLNGVGLNKVYYDYFMKSSWGNIKQKLIEAVGAENLQ